jgi:hypothetical protein
MLAIATHGVRVLRLYAAGMPAQAGLVWRIFLQNPTQDPAVQAHLERLITGRDDLEVIILPSHGVTASRNAALEQAVAEGAKVLLFGDDDMVFATEIYPELCAAFDADPDLAFLCGRLVDGEGRPHKRYNSDGTPVGLLNCAKVGTPELALRPAAFIAGGLRFETGVGAGLSLHFGEEFILLADALRAGLRGRHSALVLGEHPPDSSGLARTRAAEMVRRQVFRRALGPVKGRVFHGLWRLREYMRRLDPRGK